MIQKRIAFFLLRAAIAIVFVYAAIASFITPDNWIGYFPVVLKHMMPQSVLLDGFSLYELLLACWLLWGRYTFYAAMLAALTLSGIIIFNLDQLDIVFRDFAIILAAVSLGFFTYKHENNDLK